MIGKVFAKGLAKKATGIVARKASQVVGETTDEIVESPVKKALVTPKKASVATKSVDDSPVLPETDDGLDPFLSEGDKALIKENRLALQTEEALPAPTAAESPYNFPNKVFSDEQYAAAEKALEDSFSMESLYTKLKGNKEKFANELQKKAQKLYGNKDEDVPMPYDIQSKAKTVDEVVAEAEAKKAAAPVGEEGVVPTTQPTNINIYRGKLGNAGTSPADNNAVMEELRQHREQVYSSLSSSPKAAKYDDPVLTVALGEFRHKHGYEFDPVVKRDNTRMFKLLDEKQAEYNRLKKKYENTPDITLSHGGRPTKIESVATEGFRRPSLSKRGAQQELSSGAISLTRDMVLNYAQFGQSPENILTKEIPYAEYVFTRVNMTPKEYASKDMDALARTITGAPDKVRSLQLPRAGFGETESSMIEADKFKMERAGDRIKTDFKDYEKFNSKRTELDKKISEQSDRFVTGREDAYGDPVMPKQMTAFDARKAYSLVKEYIDNMSKLDRFTNVKSGMGQQYQEMMHLDILNKKDYLSLIERKLEETGAKQKADNMRQLVSTLERLYKTNDSKVQDSLLKLADKFNKGGLVRRK